MPKAKKLGIVGPYPPFRGGISQFTEQLHLHLEKAGRVVWGISFSRQYPQILFPGKNQESVSARPQVSSSRLLDSINPLSWRRVVSHLVEEAPEEVIIMHWMPFFAPCFAYISGKLRASGIRVTALVHNAKPHEKQPFTDSLNRYFLRRCDRIIALSRSVKRDIQAIGIEQNIEVSPHPTYSQFGNVIDREEARQRLALPKDAEIILFFGLVRRYKGLDVLLKALARGGAKSARHLVIAGEWYEDRDVCERIIDEHDLQGNITMTESYVDDTEVHLYFSAADVVVQPYRSATQSGVVQTAFQFGRPVIVTGVGGLPEMVRHDEDSLVVAPENPELLAKAIEQFFTLGTPERLGAGARESSKRHSWSSFIQLFSDASEAGTGPTPEDQTGA